MKKVLLSAVAALTLSAGSALAADLPVKAVPVVAPPPPAWDIAFGSWVASEYIFRGITQSNHKPAASAYFEARYNVNPSFQLYAGTAGSSISFPNRAAAEVDFYGGFRPTFGKLALDFGVFYYYYPGGICYNDVLVGAGCLPSLLNGNIAKDNWSFVEGYARGIYSVTDAFQLGFNYFGSPNFLNTGASGHYLSGTAKYAFPSFPNGIGSYISGEIGYQWLGTTDAWYGSAPLTDYATWNVGIGFTYKVLALDLRYTDTTLNKVECNAFTSDHTAGPNFFGAVESKWCGARFVAKLSADLTLNDNVK